MIERFKPRTRSPSRRHVTWFMVAVAVSGCVWATIERGPFDGLTLFAGLCGVLSLGLLLVPARPVLEVALRTADGTAEKFALDPRAALRPIDRQAIVDEQVAAARQTMPRPPKSALPPTPLGIAAAAQIDVFGALVSEEELEKFLEKVERHRLALHRWLEELEHQRSERARKFAGTARVSERGEAPADHARLRLKFPAGFEPPTDDPWVNEPPERPDFYPPLLPDFSSRHVPRIDLPGAQPSRPGVSYWREGEATIAELTLVA